MCAAERVAFIKQKVRVSHIQGRHDGCPLLPECLAALETEDRVRRFMGRSVAFEKPGTVIDRAGYPCARGQFDVHACRECVALIMIEEEELVAGRLEGRQATADRPSALDELMRVGDVRLGTAAAR